MIKADNPEIGSEGEESIECTFVSNSGSEDFDKTPFIICIQMPDTCLMLLIKWKLKK
jgi:hypothetical protein